LSTDPPFSRLRVTLLKRWSSAGSRDVGRFQKGAWHTRGRRNRGTTGTLNMSAQLTAAWVFRPLLWMFLH